MAQEIAFENGQISNFKRLVTLTLDWVILHNVVHHSSTSTYIPNFTKIEETFCGRADVCCTYIRTYVCTHRWNDIWDWLYWVDSVKESIQKCKKKRYFIKCSYDNRMSTYACSAESETFFSAFSHVTSTSLTHSNCTHTQTQCCTGCCKKPGHQPLGFKKGAAIVLRVTYPNGD